MRQHDFMSEEICIHGDSETAARISKSKSTWLIKLVGLRLHTVHSFTQAVPVLICRFWNLRFDLKVWKG